MNDNKIYTYMIDNRLNLEKTMNDYTNYIYAIIRNDYINFTDEDMEEIVLDVFLTLWNNQDKLDINKRMSSYIAGITRNLIKKKYRQVKINENIEDYEQELIGFGNIEISFIEREKNKIINTELNALKKEDKDIFIKYYYFENSIKEIANYYNISESRVKSKLFRIRKRLHRILKKRGYISNEK